MRLFCLGLVFWCGHGELGNWLSDVGKVHFGFWHPHTDRDGRWIGVWVHKQLVRDWGLRTGLICSGTQGHDLGRIRVGIQVSVASRGSSGNLFGFKHGRGLHRNMGSWGGQFISGVSVLRWTWLPEDSGF